MSFRFVLPATRVLTVSLFVALVAACSSSSKPKGASPSGEADARADGASKTPEPPACSNPTPIAAFDGSDIGFVSCGISSWHRTAVHACPTRLPRQTLCGFAAFDGGTSGSCRADSECKTLPKGYCTTNSRSSTCFCDYGCTEDADCGAGKICECGDPMGHCVTATCKSDADCGKLLCLRSTDASCSKTYACQSATDECTSSSDCASSLPACTLQDGRRTCQSLSGCLE